MFLKIFKCIMCWSTGRIYSAVWQTEWCLFPHPSLSFFLSKRWGGLKPVRIYMYDHTHVNRSHLLLMCLFQRDVKCVLWLWSSHSATTMQSVRDWWVTSTNPADFHCVLDVFNDNQHWDSLQLAASWCSLWHL